MFLFLKMLMALALAMPRPAEDIVAPILPADEGVVASAVATPSVVSSPVDGENKTVDSRYHHHHHNGGFGAGAGYGSIFILISPAFIQVLIYCSSN